MTRRPLRAAVPNRPPPVAGTTSLTARRGGAGCRGGTRHDGAEREHRYRLYLGLAAASDEEPPRAAARSTGTGAVARSHPCLRAAASSAVISRKSHADPGRCTDSVSSPISDAPPAPSTGAAPANFGAVGRGALISTQPILADSS